MAEKGIKSHQRARSAATFSNWKVFARLSSIYCCHAMPYYKCATLLPLEKSIAAAAVAPLTRCALSDAC